MRGGDDSTGSPGGAGSSPSTGSPTSTGSPESTGSSATTSAAPWAGLEGGLILGPCHGSKFSIEDGSRQVGPAQSGLASKNIAADGDQISVS